MNIVIMMGRLTKDPDIRYTQGSNANAIANIRLAVDRRFKREGQPDADFFDCVCFGKQAEFAEKYLHQGTKIVVQGHFQNDNYTGKDGNMVYRNRCFIDSIEFAESRASSRQYQESQQSQGQPRQTQGRGRQEEDNFMNIPDGIQEELPFN